MSVNEIMMSLEMGLIYGIVALGIYLTFRIIDFPDLTCDGSFVTGAAVASVLMKADYHPWMSMGLAMVVGGVSGYLTGLLYAKFRLTDLLSGILVGFMLYSINLRIMGGVPNITLDAHMPIITLVVVSLCLGALVTFLLSTDLGLALRSVGKNKVLAKNMGIHVHVMIVAALALSNGIIALGGALFAQHQGFADVGSGIGTVIVGLASVMIGERILPYKNIPAQVLSCFLGSIAYRFFIGFALRGDVLGLATTDLNLITGLIVIITMRLARGRHA